MPSHHDLAIDNTNLDVGGPCSRGGVCFYGPQNEHMLEELRTYMLETEQKSEKIIKTSFKLKNTCSLSIACT